MCAPRWSPCSRATFAQLRRRISGFCVGYVLPRRVATGASRTGRAMPAPITVAVLPNSPCAHLRQAAPERASVSAASVLRVADKAVLVAPKDADDDLAYRCVAWWARRTLLGNPLNTPPAFQDPGGADRDIQITVIG